MMGLPPTQTSISSLRPEEEGSGHVEGVRDTGMQVGEGLGPSVCFIPGFFYSWHLSQALKV